MKVLLIILLAAAGVLGAVEWPSKLGVAIVLLAVVQAVTIFG